MPGMNAQPELDPAARHADSARRLILNRYPDALGAVLGGSCARGRAAPGSDLDISVLLPDDGFSRREVVRHEGRVAEVFLNSRANLREIFAEDRETRRATAMFLYGESVVLYDPDGRAEALRAEARALLDAGPDPLTADERAYGRFLLTDLLDDLTETGPGSDRYEQLAVADRLLREAAHFLTAHHLAWDGAGKWLPRRLKAADAVLGEELLSGHLAVAEQAGPEPLAQAVHRVLELLGGPLHEGYVGIRRAQPPPAADVRAADRC